MILKFMTDKASYLHPVNDGNNFSKVKIDETNGIFLVSWWVLVWT